MDSRSDKRAIISWCFFDWANSAFPTVIVTFVFAAYFTENISETKEEGTALWGYTIGLSGLIIAIVAPVLGAMVDSGWRTKPWLAAFVIISSLATGALWWVEADPEFVILSLILIFIANTAFEVGMVFYNSMLGTIAPRSMVGRISGWGWGLGYLGGLSCLGLLLILFIFDDYAIFTLGSDGAANVRIVGPFVAVWFILFSIPLFLWTPDPPASTLPSQKTIKHGLLKLYRTFSRIEKFGQIIRFLVARMFYNDGLNTLFAFGGIYAAGTFGLNFTELMIFAIAMNIMAGLGSMSFAWADDRYGAKNIIIICLIGIICATGIIIFTSEIILFWVICLILGLFVGPIQSASRSLMVVMSPPEMRAEMFGFFALSGKVTAFLGPVLLGWVTVMLQSQRLGIATVMIFFIIGLILLLNVKVHEQEHAGAKS